MEIVVYLEDDNENMMVICFQAVGEDLAASVNDTWSWGVILGCHMHEREDESWAFHDDSKNLRSRLGFNL